MGRTAAKFGAFVLLCLTFTLYLASTIGNTTFAGLVGRGPSTYTVTAAFDDVSGLLRDDNVKVAGVPVGKVSAIDVTDGKAVVTMHIRSNRKLPADTTASIRWRNLIGQRYVYLDPGDASTTLEDGANIEDTTDVIDLGSLFNRLGPIVAAVDESKVNEFLESVTTALEGNEAKVSQVVDDLAFVVSGLGERDQAIGRLIDNLEVVSRTVADRDAQIQTMLDNLASLSSTFSDNTDLLDDAITQMGLLNRDLSAVLEGNRDELDGIIGSLDRTLDTVEANLGPVDILLDRLDENAAATFRSSRNGEFLNQAILCLSPTAPPCPTPIVSGISGIVGSSTPASTRAIDGIPTAGPLTRLVGGDAILSLFGAGR